MNFSSTPLGTWTPKLVKGSLATAAALMLTAVPSPAATFSSAFTVDVNAGVLSGTPFTGSVAYDNTNVATTGFSTLNLANGLSSVVFNFLGGPYTAADDTTFPLTPQLFFLDGLPVGLDYQVDRGNFFFQFDGSGFTSFTPAGFSFANQPTFSTPVPEPFSTSGVLVLGALGGWQKLKGKRIK
ncbi:hypothetical protein [Anthocerotibacter panamensis]|uniref:hypothetical protein n=1 Tax=Anthocerotibacter panamensis TaxID=2857077 RepID=UPI001C408232|nr:hypothetical protein [Anthocerotibacter panamensis]